MTRIVLPATLAIALASFSTGCMSGAETKASAGNPDARFMTEAAHSSSSELALSKVALEKATDPAVKQFAQMMVTDHQTQNQSLADLAKQQNATVPDRPDELHTKAAASLRNTPPELFDAEYMSTMVADHARTLSLLQDKAANASDPSVRGWANQQVPIIQAHLNQARQISARLGGKSTVSGGGTASMSGMDHGSHGMSGSSMGGSSSGSMAGSGGMSGSSGTSGSGATGGSPTGGGSTGGGLTRGGEVSGGATGGATGTSATISRGSGGGSGGGSTGAGSR